MSKGIGDVNSDARGSGARFNTGKTRFDLIPMSSLRTAAEVLEYGTEKYAAWNWAKGMPWSVPYACMMRHLDAWYRGEEIDPESGKSHLGHAMCNLLMLTHYEDFYPEGDDRPPAYLFRNVSVEMSVNTDEQ